MRGVVAFLSCAAALLAQSDQPAGVATIRGTVTDTAGAAVSGVMVSLDRRMVYNSMNVVSQVSSSSTDREGFYGMLAVSGGYSLRVQSGGVTVATRDVQAEAGQVIEANFVIPANPTLSGRVLDAEKHPVADASVWLIKPQYENGVLTQALVGPRVTDANGAFTFDVELEANRGYLVLADRPTPDDLVPAAAADLKERDPIQIPTYYPSAARMDAATSVILQPGERRDLEIRIATAPFYCIAGKISVAGKPASPLFSVKELALSGTKIARLVTSPAEDGTYHACGLSPGSYRLSAEDGFTDFTIHDSDRDGLDLAADPAHLTVKADWEVPAAPPDLSVLDAPGLATLRKIAAALGNPAPDDEELRQLMLRIDQLDPRLAADGNGDLPETLSKLNHDSEVFAREMGFLMGSLHGRSPILVVLFGNTTNGSGPLISGRVPFQDVLHDKLPAGDYTVSVHLMTLDDSSIKEVSYNGVGLPDRMLRIEPGATGTLRILLGRGSAGITVKVADSDGQAVPEAHLLLAPASATSPALLSRDLSTAQADQKGSHVFSNLPPGKYRVLATTQTIRTSVPEDLQKVLLALFQAKEIELGDKDRQQVTIAPILY